MTRQELLEEVQSWIGTPFRHQGRSREGVDCLGLVVESFNKVGFFFEDYPTYSKTANGIPVEEHFDKQGKKIHLSEAKVGDLIIFRECGRPRHVGVISRLNPIHVIHADGARKTVLEERLEPELKKNVLWVYKIIEGV